MACIIHSFIYNKHFILQFWRHTQLDIPWMGCRLFAGNHSRTHLFIPRGSREYPIRLSACCLEGRGDQRTQRKPMQIQKEQAKSVTKAQDWSRNLELWGSNTICTNMLSLTINTTTQFLRVKPVLALFPRLPTYNSAISHSQKSLYGVSAWL